MVQMIANPTIHQLLVRAMGTLYTQAMEARFRIQALIPWALTALAALLAIKQLDNSDTWWHLASGRWMIENWSIPSKDVLSFTVPGNDWINLQWLFDLLVYFVHGIGKSGALVLFTAAICTAMFAIMIAHLRRSVGPLATAVVAIWVLHLCQDRFVVRPEIFTFLLLQILLWLLATARENEGKRLWLLLPLMVLWVNLHSLFIIGLFCIACAIAAALAADYLPLPSSWKEGSRLVPAARRRLLMFGGLSFAVVLANPYFMRGALFPFELMTRFGESSPFSSIGEFGPSFGRWFPGIMIGSYQALLLLSCAVLLLAIWPKAGRRFDLADLLIFAGLAYLSVLAIRNTTLFALGIAPLLGRWLAACRPRGIKAPAALFKALSVAVMALLLVAAWLIATNRFYRWDGRPHQFGTSVYESRFPVQAAAFIEELDLPGPLYNDMTPGGYLTWIRPNGGKVFIDGRLEVYDLFFARYREGLRDPSRWSAQADEFGINSVLIFHGWRNRRLLIDWLNRNPAWALVYFDEVAAIFIRASGNQPSIERAREAFQDWYDKTMERLERPTPAWSYPISRIGAWRNYAALFVTLGDRQRAKECRARARLLRSAHQ
jgi:hypothetical protein